MVDEIKFVLNNSVEQSCHIWLHFGNLQCNVY